MWRSLFIISALFFLSVTNSNPFSKYYTPPPPPAAAESPKLPSTGNVNDYKAPPLDYTKCLIVNDSPHRSNNQPSFTFYNSCQEPLYINACIWDSFGESKLFQSERAIRPGARFTVYTPPFMKADQLQWEADRFNPVVPGLCQIKPPK